MIFNDLMNQSKLNSLKNVQSLLRYFHDIEKTKAKKQKFHHHPKTIIQHTEILLCFFKSFLTFSFFLLSHLNLKSNLELLIMIRTCEHEHEKSLALAD